MMQCDQTMLKDLDGAIPSDNPGNSMIIPVISMIIPVISIKILGYFYDYSVNSMITWLLRSLLGNLHDKRQWYHTLSRACATRRRSSIQSDQHALT
jgi:hypothetical protein